MYALAESTFIPGMFPERPFVDLALTLPTYLETPVLLRSATRPFGVASSKAKSTRNEHGSMAVLQAAGYNCTRAAASPGVWDIIGIGSTDAVLVQVKTRDWPGAAETETLRLFAAPANARKLVHRWRDRQRLPGVREV